MKLNRLRTVISLVAVATVFNLLGYAKPAAAVQLVGLSDNNNLILFDSDTPNAASSLQVTGVTGTLLGIDRRPSNNLIYGLTDTSNIYTINPFTGVASFVRTLPSTTIGDVGNVGNISGVDFNPVPDLLRVVGGSDQNFRINVDTGVVFVDGALNPGDPNITAVAYLNADNDPATGTILYDIDYVSDTLFIQNPPNNGTLTNAVVGGIPGIPVGSLGVDFGSTAGFDIFTANGVNTAFAASGSTLYTINLGTGAATAVGAIGSSGTTLRGLTTAVPEPNVGLVALLGVGVVGLLSRCRRFKSVI